MKISELKNMYSQFKNCYDDQDIITVLDRLNRSRETYFDDFESESEITDHSDHSEYGYYIVELGICETIKVEVQIDLESWDDDESCFLRSSYKETGEWSY